MLDADTINVVPLNDAIYAPEELIFEAKFVAVAVAVDPVEKKNAGEKFISSTGYGVVLGAVATKEYIIGGGKIEIYTDSEYSLKCLQEYCKKWSINGWIKADKKPIENRDIIEPLYNFYSMYWRQISIKHVRAHTGRQDIHSKANDIVDQMARSTIF